MKVGDLFTHTDVETRPCAHCGAPTVDCDGSLMHFSVAETGAKTAWRECYTVVRGRRKRSGTVAEIAA